MQRKFTWIINLLILSIVIFSAYNVHELGQEVIQNRYNALMNELSNVTTNFSLWISNKQATLETAKDILNNFQYEEIVSSNTLNPLLDINNDDPDFSQIYVGLASGEFITGGEWIPPEDYDPRTRVWYQKAVSSNATIISDVYIDRETEDKMVTISSPLYIEDELVGVISADVFLNNINVFLQNQIVGKNIYSFLLDAKGNIVVHTRLPEMEGVNLYDEVNTEDCSVFFEKAITTPSLVYMDYKVENEAVQGIIQKIENGDWYLAVATEGQYKSSLLKSLNRDNLILDVALLMIILILLIMIIKIKYDLVKRNKVLVSDNERDYLTGIYNRRYFNVWMETAWDKPKEDHQISLLMIDIDYFKGYNDTYGHIKGDDVLVEVTRLIKNQLRKEDIFIRYGGEEFAILLKNVTTEDTEEIGNKIIENIYDANIQNSASPLGCITVSIGIAETIPVEGPEVRAFIHQADMALYEAKRAGRNRLVLHTE